MSRIIYFLSLLLPLSGLAQPMNIFEFMQSQETLVCTLSTDMKFLVNKSHIEEYQPSELTINGKTFPVEVKTRGNSRKSICYIPPFKIKFDKEHLEVDEPNSFKLVNNCKKGNSFEQLLLKEYFVYKLYNVITPLSLESVLMQMTYQDNQDKMKPYTHFAFILEDEESFAQRHGGDIYEPKITVYNRLDTFQLAILTMFEYMVGNTDWAIGNQHNCFVVRDTVAGYPFPIPYDFDYAGLVNAPYAVPQNNTPIENVRERYNRGRCIPDKHFSQVRALFQSKQKEIMQFTETFPHFKKSTTKSTLRYLESFFDDLAHEDRAVRLFCEDCKDYE